MKRSVVGQRIPTVGELLAAFENERSGMWKRCTRKAWRGAGRRLAPLHALRVTELTTAELWRYVEHERRKERGPSTIAQALTYLRAACGVLWHERGDDDGLEAFRHWAPPQNQEGVNPQKRISKVIKRAEELFAHDVTERDAFTREEAGIVLATACAVEPRFADLVRLASETGMRGHELRGLQWDCVSRIAGVVHVRRAFSENEIGPLKTSKHRHVSVNETTSAWLCELYERRRKRCPYVFEINGRAIRENELSEAMGRILLAAQARGVRPGLTLHSFRHLYVTEGRAHMPDAWMQEQVGHSPAMQRRYSHVAVDRKSLDWADFVVTLPDSSVQHASLVGEP